AGVMVSRVDSDEDVGRQLTNQVFAKPSVMYLTGGIVGLLGLIPGMPHFPFLFMGGAAGWLGHRLTRKAVVAQNAPAPAAVSAAAAEPNEVSWEDVTLVDPLRLEVGYRLIPLVDRAQQGELLGRIKSIRKKIAQEVGFLVPVVHVCDNLEINPNNYVITLKGVAVAGGEVFPNQWLAIDPGQVGGSLPGAKTKDPAFGLPAVWIDANLRQQAQMYGYTVVDASTVVATHLNQVITTHTAELLGRQEVQQLVDQIAKQAPKLTEDIVPKLVSISGLQKILQNLLEEEVPIRDMRTILDVLAEHAAAVKDPTELTSLVRLALGRAISQQAFPGDTDMSVIMLDPKLEGVLTNALGASAGIEPGLAHNLLEQAQTAIARQEQMGLAPVLVVQH
ncbi:MAG TPA: FHIPEP family type III secretion protein, partial [Ramlibacter sp.]|nr:FHIPEP family type III secretion protein [Ramlibacter sp.]